MSGDLFLDPDACEFRVFVIWPDGQTTRYEGLKLEPADVAERLRRIASEIDAALVEEAGCHLAEAQSGDGRPAVGASKALSSSEVL